MRRSNSSVPRSGSSVSGGESSSQGPSSEPLTEKQKIPTSHHNRRRSTKRSQSSSSYAPPRTIFKVLLLVVAVLTILDVVLWRRKRLAQLEQEQQLAVEHHLRASIISPPESSPEKEEDEDDKEPIYNILRQAGVDVDGLDEATKRQLPSWKTIQRLYGSEPIFHGLERCEQFKTEIEDSIKFYGIAGTFNTGTNLLAELMIQNCQITKRMEVYGEKQKGMRWQVPWGKHQPATFRETHVTTTDKEVPTNHSLPLITIRDPYNWMQSMCRHHYEAQWAHSEQYCPAVVQPRHPEKLNPVSIDFGHAHVVHDSLPHLYNTYYQDYLQVDYPRIFVRFEDLLFYGENVTRTLCACGGGDPRSDHPDGFRHIFKSAKLGTAAHGTHKTTLVQALIKYGTDVDRLHGLSKEEIERTNDILDDDIMKLFHYQYAPVPEE